jgi:hypothetical protein
MTAPSGAKSAAKKISAESGNTKGFFGVVPAMSDLTWISPAGAL